jgi:hypothetical protein
MGLAIMRIFPDKSRDPLRSYRNTQEEIPAFERHFVTEKNGEVSIAHKPAQTIDVFRSVIESGVTKCDEIAAVMKVPKYTVSRLAKKAIEAK